MSRAVLMTSSAIDGLVVCALRPAIATPPQPPSPPQIFTNLPSHLFLGDLESLMQ